MKASDLLLVPVVAGLLAVAMQDVRAASSALTLTTVGATFETGGNYTLGFEFMVSEELRVVTLGVFDGGLPGLTAPAQVSLWQDDLTGTLLATTQVPAGAGATVVGQFRHATITPVIVLPGIRYVVGAYLPAGEATSFNMGDGGSTGSFDTRLTNVVDRSWDGGYDFPLGSDNVAGAAWLGANFQLAAVAEPASASLLAAGLLGAALWRRRRGAATTTVRRAETCGPSSGAALPSAPATA